MASKINKLTGSTIKKEKREKREKEKNHSPPSSPPSPPKSVFPLKPPHLPPHPPAPSGFFPGQTHLPSPPPHPIFLTLPYLTSSLRLIISQHLNNFLTTSLVHIFFFPLFLDPLPGLGFAGVRGLGVFVAPGPHQAGKQGISLPPNFLRVFLSPSPPTSPPSVPSPPLSPPFPGFSSSLPGLPPPPPPGVGPLPGGSRSAGEIFCPSRATRKKTARPGAPVPVPPWPETLSGSVGGRSSQLSAPTRCSASAWKSLAPSALAMSASAVSARSLLTAQQVTNQLPACDRKNDCRETDPPAVKPAGRCQSVRASRSDGRLAKQRRLAGRTGLGLGFEIQMSGPSRPRSSAAPRSGKHRHTTHPPAPGFHPTGSGPARPCPDAGSD